MYILPTLEDWLYIKEKIKENPEEWTPREQINIERIISIFDAMMLDRDIAMELLVGYWSTNA